MSNSWSRLDTTLTGRLAHRRGLVNGTGSIALLLLGALAGVVVTDLAEFSRVVSYVALGVLAALMLIVNILTRVIARRRGTLYYVSLLEESMPDLHARTVENLRAEYFPVKAFPGRIDPRISENAVSDFSPDVATLAQEVRQALVSDDSLSGYHVAPNLLWPAAMALGYEIAWPAGTELLDLPSSAPPDPAKGHPASAVMKWTPEPAGAGPETSPKVKWTVARAGAEVVRTVLIKVELTDQGPADRLRWPVDVVYRVGVFADPEPQRIADRGDIPDILRTQVNVAAEAELGGVSVVHPQEAAEACWKVLRLALHEYPDAMHLLLWRVPKTVGLAVGAMLARDGKTRDDPGCGHAGCMNWSCRAPWSAMAPLAYSRAAGDNPYIITRVHDGMPTDVQLLNLRSELS